MNLANIDMNWISRLAFLRTVSLFTLVLFCIPLLYLINNRMVQCVLFYSSFILSMSLAVKLVALVFDKIIQNNFSVYLTDLAATFFVFLTLSGFLSDSLTAQITSLGVLAFIEWIVPFISLMVAFYLPEKEKKPLLYLSGIGIAFVIGYWIDLRSNSSSV